MAFAHRGLHKSVPENTLAAFRAAVQAGVDGIETDVQLDRNGTPILFHDTKLPGGRSVDQFTRDELSNLVGYEVPELREALDAVSGTLWNLELKTLDAVEPALAVMSDYTRKRQILVSSFLHPAVDAVVRRLDVRGALLVCHCPHGALLNPNDLHPSIKAVVWYCETVDSSALDWATSVNLENLVYGFESSSDHSDFIRTNVAALITDFPEDLMGLT
jgi:glycerophosphoryl diester phosphodiesterase